MSYIVKNPLSGLIIAGKKSKYGVWSELNKFTSQQMNFTFPRDWNIQRGYVKNLKNSKLKPKPVQGKITINKPNIVGVRNVFRLKMPNLVLPGRQINKQSKKRGGK
jgi:hypothetical protein